MTLPNGNGAMAISKLVKSLPGQVIVIQERNEPLWGSDAALSMTLSATTGFVVLILGFAFHWQSTRAREGDLINDAVRGRIDTALNRGRCGLWDWDLSRGRIFWSQSMFTMLGLDSRNDLLTFGEVNALVKSDDIDLFAIADQLISGKLDHIDQTFRMQHTDGHWIWLRVRCELSQAAADSGLHLIGIAVDITEQKSLAEKTVEADLRLRDAIETIPEAFVLWDAEDRLVLCNSHFQRLHKLPDSAVTPGTSYETVIEVGSMPEVRTTAAGDRHPGAGRAHLRGPARRRQLAAHQRAPHQGRRLRLGRHRHHEDQGARAEAGRKRRADARQRARPETLEGGTGRPRRKILGRKDPRRGSQPGQVEIPRQYEPRAAHAAQRHHRLLRDHGQRPVRRARLRQVSGVLPRHPDIGQIPARSHQRHPRHVEDRSRPHEARHEAARPVEDSGGIAARGVGPRRGQASRRSTPISKAPSRSSPTAARSSRSSSICCPMR